MKTTADARALAKLDALLADLFRKVETEQLLLGVDPDCVDELLASAADDTHRRITEVFAEQGLRWPGARVLDDLRGRCD